MLTKLARGSPDEVLWSTDLVFANGEEIAYDQWHPTSSHVAVDGSCLPNPISDFTRAGWAVAFFDEQSGEGQHSAAGPVWGSLPRTSQAGEFTTMAAAAQLSAAAGIKAEVHTDCKVVSDDFRRADEQRLRPTAAYG